VQEQTVTVALRQGANHGVQLALSIAPHELCLRIQSRIELNPGQVHVLGVMRGLPLVRAVSLERQIVRDPEEPGDQVGAIPAEAQMTKQRTVDRETSSASARSTS
jgi:hypothetical protein